MIVEIFGGEYDGEMMEFPDGTKAVAIVSLEAWSEASLLPIEYRADGSAFIKIL